MAYPTTQIAGADRVGVEGKNLINERFADAGKQRPGGKL